MLNQSHKYEILAFLGRVSSPMSTTDIATTLAVEEGVTLLDLNELLRRRDVVLVREDRCGNAFWAAVRGQYGADRVVQSRAHARQRPTLHA